MAGGDADEAAPYACVRGDARSIFSGECCERSGGAESRVCGGLLRVRGTYSKFLEGRENYMEAQQKMQEGLRNRVNIEIEWLRRGPKARATKAKARIDNAHGLIAKLADVDSRTTTSSRGD